MLPPDAQTRIEATIDAVSAGDYAGALSVVDASRCSGVHLKSVVDQYGRTLTSSRDTNWDIVAFAPPAPEGWSVYAPLWSVEEGLSDLQLRFSVVRQDGRCHVTLDDLRVP